MIRISLVGGHVHSFFFCLLLSFSSVYGIRVQQDERRDPIAPRRASLYAVWKKKLLTCSSGIVIAFV